MNKILSILLLFILSTIACKKDKDLSQNSYTPHSNVFYKDFNPDTIISIPSIVDTYSFNLDVSNDLIPDMFFSLNRSYYYTVHTTFNNYFISVSGSAALKFITTSHLSGGCKLPLDTSVYIGMHSQVDPNSYSNFILEEIRPPYWSCSTFTQKGFVGFRLHQFGQDYYGWIRFQVPSPISILIDDFAICHFPNDSIKVGEH